MKRAVELGPAIGGDVEARGGAMTAVADQQIAAGDESLGQVDAAAAPTRGPQRCRPRRRGLSATTAGRPRVFCEAARDEADDPDAPLPSDEDRRRQVGEGSGRRSRSGGHRAGGFSGFVRRRPSRPGPSPSSRLASAIASRVISRRSRLAFSISAASSSASARSAASSSRAARPASPTLPAALSRGAIAYPMSSGRADRAPLRPAL